MRCRTLLLLLLFEPVFGGTPVAAKDFSTCYSVTRSTVLGEMKRLQKQHGIHFVYNSSLWLDMEYTGPDLSQMALGKALERLFEPNGIEYKLRKRNVMLRLATKHVQQPVAATQPIATYCLRGNVSDMQGEPIVNATIFDLKSKKGTLTDSRGRYLLHLAGGQHCLRVSSIGCNADTLYVDIHSDWSHDFRLAQTVELEEVVVSEDMNSPMLTTQTGKRTFTAKDINNGFALLSSPDLVKTIQKTSGVASGLDFASGMYVHGGGGDENLFLLDGTPLYQTNHSLGLFSAFNSDIIKNVDFYKSGFPARYSGRVSSITDVRTCDGNMERVKGAVTMGILDGRIHVEGPISKDRTSFNVSLRRSWLDLLLRPICAITNKGRDDKYMLGYVFHDFNAKLTHHVNNRTTLWTSMYSGYDSYSVDDKSQWSDNVNDTENRMAWGNLTVTLGGDFQLSSTLSLQAMLTGTYSHSRQKSSEDDYDMVANNGHRRNYLDMRLNSTQMIDVSAHTDFSWRPTSCHHIQFGAALTRHQFRPQTKRQAFYYGDPHVGCDTTYMNSRVNTLSHEVTIYAEDEMRLNESLSANVGTSMTTTVVDRQTYLMLDPRFAMKWQFSNSASLKLSYTHMSQSIHRMSSSFLELPTDFWVPTTDEIKPTMSHQIAAGVYAQPSPRLTLSVETYYKQSTHLLQYRHWMGFQPSAATWNRDVADGKGRSYGIEADATYTTGRTTMSMAYTLSWSRRLFKDIYPEWFDDQFDNRHKLNLSFRHSFSRRVSIYAAWMFHSGNRVTMPVGFAIQPTIPGDNGYSYDYVFDRPNNFRLPPYHRLDIGANFHHTTRSGKEAIWNVSIYNAYCHLNTMYVKVRRDENNKFQIKSHGYVPIIPSISYTLKF